MKKLLLITTLFLICLQAVAQDFWIPLNTPENFKVRSMTSNSHGVYFGANDGVYRTLDNGKTIEKAGLNSGIPSLTVDANDRIYAGSRNLHFSDDNGNTWDTIPTPECPFVIHVNEKFIFFSNTDRIYKKGHNDTVWTMVFDDNDDCPITSFTQSSEGVLFAGAINFFGYDSGVYRSFDEGDTWEHCWQVQNFVDALDVDSLGNIYAGCGGGGIGLYKSSDLGTTWQNIKYGVGVLSIAITPNNDIYIGCSREFGTVGGVYRSMDNGVTWEWIVAGLTNFYVEKLSITKDGYLFAGAWNKFGNPLFRTTTPVVTNIESLEKDKQLLIYPNPVNNILTFSTCLSLEGKTAQVKIYNIAGKKVLEKKLQLSSNNNLDISYLKTGTYIFCLQLSNQIFTKKFLKT